jgi:outer membrane protein assembly factor BamA
MDLFRAALTVLGLAAATIGSVARAADPPAGPALPVNTPGARALLAPEEPAVGSTIPELGDLLDSSLDGKPIRRVEVVVVGERWITRPVITRIRLGEPLSAEAGRRATRELLDTGGFARASVEAIAEGDGALLRLHVLPRRLIAAIQMTGATLDRGDTLEAAEISDGGELTSPLLDQIGPRIQRYYAAHGFPAAQVKIDTTDTDKADRVVLSLEISAGAPRTIDRRVFVIDPALDQEVGALKGKYRFATGARVDEPALVEADRELAELLHKGGFLRAEVRHSLHRDGPLTELQVHLDPGPRLVALFDGNRAFDAGDLTGALNLEKSPDPRLGELIERVRSYYVSRGFFDVEVAATEKGKPGEAVHYLAFVLRENRQVRVTRRVFPCLSPTIKPDDVGSEIDSFLSEELPGNETFSAVDPRQIERLFGPTQSTGGRGLSTDLNPLLTYAPDTYDRALKHLRDLYRSRGYLNAVVGPVSLLRATCSRRSPAGQCVPEPPRGRLGAHCLKDSLGLPLPEPPAPESFTCRPDPAHDVECAPEVQVRIPIHLGPRTRLYDLAFEGNRQLTEQELGEIAQLPLGDPLSTLELEAARLRLVDAYRLRGWVYTDVRSTIEPSPDRSRARVRFSLTEREKVTVSGFVVKGAARTDPGLILRRLLLKVGGDFRQDLVRGSEERIATLGTFASVSVALEDPEVPQRRKRVVITVVEQPSQYLEPRLGFSTGEGGRFAFEYGHRNIAGLAIALTLRIQLGYVFDFLLDPAVRQNYGLDRPSGSSSFNPAVGVDRIERRDTISLNFPDIGLGPVVSLSLDGIDIRHNQRDFGLTKDAIVPTLSYRPARQLVGQLSVSAERNEVQIFNQSAQSGTISNLIRAPEGTTAAFSQKVAVVWDRRDNTFAATRGTLLSTSVEHVDAFPALGDATAKDSSHMLRLSGRFTGYLRLPLGMSVAASIAGGVNVHLVGGSKAYPDRLFFLGGVDSIRAFLADSMVPEDTAQQLLALTDANLRDPNRCTRSVFPTPGEKLPLSICSVPIRGGDVSINPRLELRFPLTSSFQGGLFLDMGNVWTDVSLIRPWVLRYGLGPGLRIGTPIGPIALDYGFNLTRRPWESIGAFHFSIGLF